MGGKGRSNGGRYLVGSYTLYRSALRRDFSDRDPRVSQFHFIHVRQCVSVDGLVDEVQVLCVT